jgi:hypothetical protein
MDRRRTTLPREIPRHQDPDAGRWILSHRLYRVVFRLLTRLVI